MHLKKKSLLTATVLGLASLAYAGANYEVTLGVRPGCTSGATMTTTVWAEGEFAACDVAKNSTFMYCCGVKKK